MLRPYIIFSAGIHMSLVVGLFFSSPDVSVDFDIRRGVSALKVTVKENEKKKKPEKKQKPEHFSIIVSQGGSFFINTGAEKKKNTLEGENLQSGKLGALYKKSRFNSVNFPPKYPYLAQRIGYHGSVRLAIEVLPNGRTGTVSIVKSSGRKILDESALSAARRWIFFRPGEMKLDKPMIVNQDIEFRLTNSR